MLPAPPDEFLEYEAAMAWGYKLSEWRAESIYVRARAVTHFLHSRMREGYQMEKAMAKSDSKDGKPKGNDIGKLDSMMKVLKPGGKINLPGVEVTRSAK